MNSKCFFIKNADGYTCCVAVDVVGVMYSSEVVNDG